MHGSRSSHRVLLFGLDGITWDLLKPWVDAGHLPNLGSLMAAGTWGVLTSTIIPQTPLAWTSMVTGVQPGKHGILGFIKRRPGSYEKTLTTSLDRRRAALWNLLGQAGKRSVILDVPLTFPPEALNGLMVAGLGTPGVESDFVWPPGFKHAIVGESAAYEFDIYYSGNLQRFIGDAVRVTEHRIALAKRLLRESPWDFFMVVLTTTDRLQHVIWKHVDERHPQYDSAEAQKHLPTILGFYQLLDRAIGDFRALVDDDTVLMITSDHGFEPVHTKVSLTRWLAAEGLVALGGQRWTFHPSEMAGAGSTRGGGAVTLSGDRESLLTLAVQVPSDYAGVVLDLKGVKPTSSYEVRIVVADATEGAALDITDLTRPGGQIIGGAALNAGPGEVTAVFNPHGDTTQIMVAMTTYGGNPPGQVAVSTVVVTELEDWTRTSAYILDVGEAGESRRIRVNLKGREPCGIVDPGEEYERLIAQITTRLRSLTDATTGRPLVAEVHREDQVFAGPFRDDAADLLVILAEGAGGMSPLGRSDYSGPVSYPATIGFSGKHHMNGAFLASGAPINQGLNADADIVDICPTVLHLLDVPAPHDVDGRVLWEILTPEFQRSRPVRVAAPIGDPGPAGAQAEVYTDEQRQQVEDRLRRLGYIE